MIGSEALVIYSTGFLGALFLIFSVRQLVHGRSHSARIERDGGSVLLGKFIMEFGYWFLSPMSRFCIKFKISPNALSFSCLGFAIGAGFCFGFGRFTLAGLMLAVSALMDALDGMVARARGVGTDFGKVVDSTVDRISELAICFGMIFYYRFDTLALWLVCITILGSVLVSYATAKGEAMHLNPPRGVMRRAERAVYISLGAVFAPIISNYLEPQVETPRFFLMLAILALVGILSTLSAVYRYTWIYNELKKQSSQ